MLVDSVVIGGGPAGLSAALLLARQGREVLVLDTNRPRNAVTLAAHGIIGLEGISPMELRARARDQARLFGARWLLAEVFQLTRGSAGLWRVLARDARSKEEICIEAKAILISTGFREEFPDIDELRAWYGSALHSCLECDLYEKKGKDLALILGYSESFAALHGGLLENARLILSQARSLTVFTHGGDLDPGIRRELGIMGVRLVCEPILRAESSAGKFSGFRGESGRLYPQTLGFICPMLTPNLDFLAPKNPDSVSLERTGRGFLAADEQGKTSRLGVWAAGDLVGAGQVSIACGQGALAARSINRNLALDFASESEFD